MAKAINFDPAKHGDNPKMIAQYLTSALATDDAAAIGRALRVVVRSQNVLALSEESGLGRGGLYKKFRPAADPRLGHLRKLFPVLGVRLVVEPIPGASVKIRPKQRQMPPSRLED